MVHPVFRMFKSEEKRRGTSKDIGNKRSCRNVNELGPIGSEARTKEIHVWRWAQWTKQLNTFLTVINRSNKTTDLNPIGHSSGI